MKVYFADTNFYLRFLLQDDEIQADEAERYLKRAKHKKLRIVFLSAVILEMGFVLKSVYSLSAAEIAKHLLRLVKTVYLEIEDRKVWLMVLPIYARDMIDLIDVWLWEKAKQEEAEIVSFDEDFKRFKK